MNRMLFALFLLLAVSIPSLTWANGGPFFIAYPDGDHSSKGVLAVLGENLLPRSEDGLQVLSEDLTVRYDQWLAPAPDLGQGRRRYVFPYQVEARYEIKNDSGRDSVAYFGFPILGGQVISNPLSMRAWDPGFHVQVDGRGVAVQLLYAQHINGLLRANAHNTIQRWIKADPSRQEQVESIRTAEGFVKKSALAAFQAHLTEKEDLSETHAILFAELVGLGLVEDTDLTEKTKPRWRGATFSPGVIIRADGEQPIPVEELDLGPLEAIGQQKATQLWTEVASALDPDHDYSYAHFFESWGGQTRELALDPATGQLRPRENQLARFEAADAPESTMYGRVDYLEDENLDPEIKDSLTRVLENLPVIFSYTPMYLGVYEVNFPANQTRIVQVTYKQDSFIDTRDPKSYQMCYVIKTALNWKKFGKINVRVEAPVALEVVSDPPLEREPAVTDDGRAAYTTVLTSYDRNLRLAIPAEPAEAQQSIRTGRTQQTGRRTKG